MTPSRGRRRSRRDDPSGVTPRGIPHPVHAPRCRGHGQPPPRFTGAPDTARHNKTTCAADDHHVRSLIMQVGVHGLVFTGEFDEAGLVTAAPGALAAGFDRLEVPLAAPWALAGATARRILSDHGVAMSASLGLTAQTDLSSEDAAVSGRGEDLLRRAIDVVAEAGGQHLCGVIYSAMQKYMAPA